MVVNRSVSVPFVLDGFVVGEGEGEGEGGSDCVMVGVVVELDVCACVLYITGEGVVVVVVVVVVIGLVVGERDGVTLVVMGDVIFALILCYVMCCLLFIFDRY